MIVRETPSSFHCIKQHDHARVAGVLIEHWQPAHFKGTALRPEVELAVQQHDRGWIPLDATPTWNEQTHAPHSFLDFPAEPKVRHYQQGIAEVEDMASYAGLLCSLHYTGFPDLAKTEIGQHFLATEEQRQQRLQQQLGLNTNAQQHIFDFHLQLLKFADRLSLYFCLNEPGADKTHEHPWYRDGIPFSDFFAFTQHQLVQAHWLSENQVRVQPFPFEDSFSIKLRYKELPKEHLTAEKLADCFRQAPLQELEVRIVQ
ncbi:DUF3891 family protein [Hymenobacter volaticus]|uniref:DUF3891 family protein n=1 Tax=Hymenobacter volaticus TaxID=2932254 RepID=A0ABY4G1H2_9BACT|nr:DUF3891 family protein [Hymenobacter volaticus]UOQ64720.1 DUF3891 family protein [Hymenobacter volaticus]